MGQQGKYFEMFEIQSHYSKENIVGDGVLDVPNEKEGNENA
jgi:hypothetical protein